VLRARTLLLFASSMLFAGCAAAPAPRADVDVTPLHDVERAQFPGADALLAAFDARPADERKVDAALFAVAMHRDGEVDRRLLWLESAPGGQKKVVDGALVDVTVRRGASITITPKGGEPETRDYMLTQRPATLRHCRHDGSLVRESTIKLYDEPMRAGFWGYVNPDATRRERDLCSLYTMTLQSLADEDEALQELLFLLVEKPSVLSVVANFGVRVYLSWSVTREAPIAWPEPARPEQGWGDELRALQMQIDVNGAPALQGDLVVCAPDGGLAMGGGLCGAVFRHPSDETRWAAVRLLAVRTAPSASEQP